MRNFWHRTIEVATSWMTALLTFVTVGYAIALRGLGVAPDSTSVVQSFHQFLSDGSLRAFFLCPTWLLACFIWTLSEQSAYVLIRVGSKRASLAQQILQSVAESTLILVPLLIGSFVFAFGGTHNQTSTAVPTSLTRVVGEVLLVGLALVAARSVIAAVSLLTNSRLLVGSVAVLIWISGAASASGVPLTSVFGMMSWITWTAPALAGEVFGTAWIGAFFLVGVGVAAYALVALHETGPRAWRSVRPPIALMSGAVAVIAGQYAVLHTVAQLGTRIDWRTALTILFEGPEPNQIGLALGPFFLSLVFYFGPAFAMLGRLQDELGGWMSLVVIRSGSHLIWVVQFMRRWLLVSAVSLACGLFSSTAAWLLLPDSERATGISAPSLLALGVRYGLVGLLQIFLYCLLGFVVVWLSGETATSLGLLVALAAAGVANPLIGNWAPAYLNALSRSTLGWAGQLHDVLTLITWSLAAIATIVIIAKIRDRPGKERRRYGSHQRG